MMDIDKIRDEMAEKHDDGAIVTIGEYVSERIMKGAKLLEGKTLTGAYKEMEKYAREHRKGNSCCIPPQKAFEIVDAYFEFGKDAEAQAAPAN